MNAKQQTINELNGLRQLIEMIEEEFNKGYLNDDGDTTLPESAALKIAVLLEQ
jgi:hypothetical protein